MKIEISAVIDKSFEKTAWNIFFKSKHRGVSFDRHFPWLQSGSNRVWYLSAKVNGELIAGLVIKEKICSIDGVNYKIGLIGLVCVVEAFRGCGIASKLILETVAFAVAEQFDALTLWTGKSELYAKHGFAIRDSWLFGSVKRKTNSKAESEPLQLIKNQRPRIDIPLPPNAYSLTEYWEDKSAALIAEDSTGKTLMGYTGNAPLVAKMLAAQMPPVWRINVATNDPLISLLLNFDLEVDVRPCNLQMWLCLSKNYGIDTIAEKVILSPLERI
jgi:GNAT superfamily N-acetyltransferase